MSAKQTTEVMTCEGCEDCAVTGVRYPSDVHGDTSKPWVERCDYCQLYESDVDAARAAIAAGIGTNIGHSYPHGSTRLQPYIIGHVSTFPGTAPQPTEGQIDLNGDALRAPSIHERPYACCPKALVLPSSCVCFFESTCPDHGKRHNGTHD